MVGIIICYTAGTQRGFVGVWGLWAPFFTKVRKLAHPSLSILTVLETFLSHTMHCWDRVPHFFGIINISKKAMERYKIWTICFIPNHVNRL